MAFDVAGRRITDEDRFSEEYKTYIKSSRWKALRAQLIKLRGGCEKCGTPTGLQVHHVTYERLGREKLTDLEVLCYGCHKQSDIERREQARREREDRLWEARLDGWATKRYGENWELRECYDYVHDEFVEWLERKELEESSGIWF